MLYYLFDWLDRLYNLPGFGVFQYISFRAALAALFSLLISLVIGRSIILFLKRKLIGETIRTVGPQSHHSKAGTPTMGGLIIIAALTIPTLLWGDLTNAYVWLLLLVTIWMGLIGFLDDYIKVFLKQKKGLHGRFKIYGQVLIGLIAGLVMVFHADFQGHYPRLSHDGFIKSNEYLRSLGFNDGDHLVAINQQPIDSTTIAELRKQVKPTALPISYTISRLNRKSQKISQIRVTVKGEDQARTHAQLFGHTDSDFTTKTNIPFNKQYEFNYNRLLFSAVDGIWAKLIYILVVIFIITAVSNGVNITDGLDGLAAGTSAIVALSLGVFAYISGNLYFADYINITFIPHAGEVVIFCSALIGACVGFLWYNTHPAQVFMGDTGSLAIGGAIGVLALMIKKELLLPLICGVFFVESLSVIIQVSYFKYTKKKYGEGRRIFKMSPIHHHFELLGFHESKIVTRFWIVTILLEILAFATLKLR
jgi:phospho-N-acetylmuramoyl-pentapeptide-transferase